jgi:hypothetical protein
VKRWLTITVVVAAGAAAGPTPQRGGSKVAGKKAVVADDPREVVTIALKLARSASPADHQSLETNLRSRDFLARLDSAEEYSDTRRRLRIARVLEALAANPTPSAANVLVNLTTVPEFLREARRVDFLIMYSADVRPAPPGLVAFWDKHSQPDDGYTHLTIGTLTRNGTGPALALLERKLADKAHPDDDKQFWMRSYMLPHRNEVPLLLTVERLLSGSLPANLRPDLVEAIFDYHPDQWYSEAAVVLAPNRQMASPEAREVLRRIGHLALTTVALTEAQQAAVQKVLAEIGPG